MDRKQETLKERVAWTMQVAGREREERNAFHINWNRGKCVKIFFGTDDGMHRKRSWGRGVDYSLVVLN
jgi:hypothetical protein